MSTPAKVIAELQQFPPDVSILCQVVGKQGGAWNMHYEFAKPLEGNFVVLSVSHPDLQVLPEIAFGGGTQYPPGRVALMDPLTQKLTGEKIFDIEATKFIAALQQRVADLEGELSRRGLDVDEFYRADQNCVCSCGKLYREHPYGGPIGIERSMFLHRLCNGDLVKL